MTNSVKIFLTITRGYRQYSKHWLKDAVRYGNVKFHPRVPDHVDPPITPSKVLMVKRVKPFKGNPYWENDTLKKLGFEERKNDFVFVKNTPDMCAMLWRVKHLVKIDPVTLPKNLPSTVDDLTEFYVNDNGKVYVTGKIDPVRRQATIDAKTSIKVMKSKTIQEQLRLRWLKGNLI